MVLIILDLKSRWREFNQNDVMHFNVKNIKQRIQVLTLNLIKIISRITRDSFVPASNKMKIPYISFIALFTNPVKS